uniref:Charged protein n=1 Tax=Tobacco mosaic virus TaxID=12242 RepID=A0A2D2PZ93_9VIRU|nr:charged protein [Tobacco mosaic virus]
MMIRRLLSPNRIRFKYVLQYHYSIPVRVLVISVGRPNRVN